MTQACRQTARGRAVDKMRYNSPNKRTAHLQNKQQFAQCPGANKMPWHAANSKAGDADMDAIGIDMCAHKQEHEHRRSTNKGMTIVVQVSQLVCVAAGVCCFCTVHICAG